MFCDIKILTAEDLVGRLCATEDFFDDKVEHIPNKAGRLLLATQEWLEKHKQHFQENSHKESSSGGSVQWNEKMLHRFEDSSSGYSNNKPKLTSKGTPKRKGRCRNCGIYGH